MRSGSGFVIARDHDFFAAGRLLHQLEEPGFRLGHVRRSARAGSACWSFQMYHLGNRQPGAWLARGTVLKPITLDDMSGVTIEAGEPKNG